MFLLDYYYILIMLILYSYYININMLLFLGKKVTKKTKNNVYERGFACWYG